VPDLQSCSAFGGTPAEALAEIEQAIEAWLAVAREDGPPIPEPCYRAPTRAAGVESVQAIRSCLVPTLTGIAGLEANVSDGWTPVLRRGGPGRRGCAENGHLHTRSRTGGVDSKQAFGSAEPLSTWRSDRSGIEISGADRALARNLFAIERFEGICSVTTTSQ
jgi:hypothetical protein